MPVVATVERGRQRARWRNVRVGAHGVRDLVRILLMHTRKGEVCETLRGTGIKLSGGDGTGEKGHCESDEETGHAVKDIADASDSAPRCTFCRATHQVCVKLEVHPAIHTRGARR